MSCAQTYARREHELLLENRRNLQLPNGDIQSRASSSYIVSLTVARRSTRSRVGRVLAFLGGCPVPPRLNMRLALSTSRYMLFLFRLAPGYWALLRAKFLRTAHGGPSASRSHVPSGFRLPRKVFLSRSQTSVRKKKLSSVPPEKHSLGLRAAASRSISAPTTRGFT